MSDDATLPATKGDLSLLRGEMHEMGSQLRREMKEMGVQIISEMKHYFDFTVETIRHDLLGANKDDIEVMKDRITRLEKHTGLVTQ